MRGDGVLAWNIGVVEYWCHFIKGVVKRKNTSQKILVSELEQ